MIKLKIVENQGARMVVNELGTLIKECGVIFISFDDEVPGITETSGLLEIRRNATDQETGRMAGILQNPGNPFGPPFVGGCVTDEEVFLVVRHW